MVRPFGERSVASAIDARLLELILAVEPVARKIGLHSGAALGGGGVVVLVVGLRSSGS